jgi:transcriptional regulator with XRE-family HTH domain
MAKEIVKSGEIGEAIKSRRKELGWSQDELAEKIGVTLHQVQRYEGGRTILNVENIQRIADALGLPVADFFASGKPATVAEPVESYFATDEKALLRHYRSITVVADRKMAANLVKRLAKK